MFFSLFVFFSHFLVFYSFFHLLEIFAYTKNKSICKWPTHWRVFFCLGNAALDNTSLWIFACRYGATEWRSHKVFLWHKYGRIGWNVVLDQQLNFCRWRTALTHNLTTLKGVCSVAVHEQNNALFAPFAIST